MFIFHHLIVFFYKNLYVGNNVYIGYHADFVSTRSKIIINDHVVFGPNVSIRGGDHRTDIVGRFIDEIKDCDKLQKMMQMLYLKAIIGLV